MSGATYDQWKLRSDLDELQPDVEPNTCECGGVDGSHDRLCPERDGDFIDREIDRAEEACP